MAAKMTIDLGPVGPAGIEASSWDKDGKRYLWICGSDHWRDWLHHVWPGAKRREIAAAHAILTSVESPEVKRYVVGGHSLGGCVASILATLMRERGLQVDAVLCGPKRAPKGYVTGEAVIHRGDVVPSLPPWRPAYKSAAYMGERKPFWIAHDPGNYRHIRRLAGL